MNMKTKIILKCYNRCTEKREENQLKCSVYTREAH